MDPQVLSWPLLQSDGLKVSQHTALGSPDLAKTSLSTVCVTDRGMNHQEAQRGTGEKFLLTFNCELIFLSYATDLMLVLSFFPNFKPRLAFMFNSIKHSKKGCCVLAHLTI